MEDLETLDMTSPEYLPLSHEPNWNFSRRTEKFGYDESRVPPPQHTHQVGNFGYDQSRVPLPANWNFSWKTLCR